MSWKRISLFAAGFLLLSAARSFGANDLSPVERVWWAQGLTHPMVVHIPIALLLSGAIAAILRVVFRSIPHSVVYYCLLIGTLGAIPSILAGWAWAPQQDSSYRNAFEDNGIALHRWGAVAVTAVGLLVLAWATRQLHRKIRYEKAIVLRNTEGREVGEVHQTKTQHPIQRPGQFGWQFCVVLLAIAMGWVAHTGGEQVYPDNFENIMKLATGKELPSHIEKEMKRKEREAQLAAVQAAGPAATNPAAPTTGPSVTPTAAGGSIDFAKQVWPIFEEKCIYCHGADKDKGDLRMHTEADALKGGDLGPLYIPGNPEDSPLIQFIVIDDEEEVMPPPKENKKITEEELRILRQWVTEGAAWTPVSAN